MKKLKLVFIAIALLAGVGGAFGTRPDPGCEWEQQYHYNGAGYQWIFGEYGVSWYCELEESENCSYYKPNPGQEVYFPCRIGIYHPVFK